MVVDEAHGPHMYFLEPQPGKPGDVPERVPGQTPAAAGGPSWNSCLALKQDIDACVHGAHKTLGSLTGTGLLHLKGNRLDPGRVNQALLAVQTSSPSYLMMASLDLARRDMALNGRRWLGEAVAEAEEAREGLRSAGIEFCCPDRPFDPTRLVIGSPQFGLTGRGLSAALRAGGVQAEQAGLLYVLLVFSVGDSPGSGRRLVEALTRIQMAQRSGQSTDHRAGVRARAGARPAQAPPATDVARATSAAQTLAGMDLPSRGLTPRRAWMAAWREVPLAESVGRVAAESIFLYPPGAPLLVAGEIVPLEMPGLVRELCLLGADFQGPADLSMARLRVVEG
jgi:arginine/lysine/ornithine decarboxylase